MAVGGPWRTRLALFTIHTTTAMSNEHTPLLSDEKSREIEMKWQEAHGADITHTMAFSDGIATVRDLYEAERAKDRELLHKLVEAGRCLLEELVANDNGAGSSNNERIRMLNAWESAVKEAGITPTDQ